MWSVRRAQKAPLREEKTLVSRKNCQYKAIRAFRHVDTHLTTTFCELANWAMLSATQVVSKGGKDEKKNAAGLCRVDTRPRIEESRDVALSRTAG